MRSLVRSKVTTLAAVTLAAASTSVAVALANTGDEPSSASALDASKSFRILSEPPVANVPEAVRDFAADPRIASDYAPDPERTHAIDLPNGSGVAYLVEGKDSLCFYVSGVGHCNTLVAAEAGRMFAVGVKVPPFGKAPAAGDGPAAVIGVAPDRFTTAAASTASGRVTASIGSNMYKLEGTNIDGFELSGASDVTPVSVGLNP